MGKCREFWIFDGECYPFQSNAERAQIKFAPWQEIIHVREVMEDESTDQPTELEMHRADHRSVKAAGFECVSELLAAYKVLLAKTAIEPVQQKPVAWMAFGACTAAPVFSDTPPDDVNLAGWEPLYRHPQPDHAAALADATESLMKLMHMDPQDFDTPYGWAYDSLYRKISAYRASQKGGNHG